MRTSQTNTPEETSALGGKIARHLQPADSLLIEGELGAGKTALVRGIVKGLGSSDHVSSPTFVIIHEYKAAIPIAHVDLYRLTDTSDVEDLGLHEYLDAGFVVLVEWPGQSGGFDWGKGVWRISIEVVGVRRRIITIGPPVGRSVDL